jgi:hypothetical protein
MPRGNYGCGRTKKKSFFQIVQIFVTCYAYMHVRGGVNGMKDDINIGRNTMNEKEG